MNIYIDESGTFTGFGQVNQPSAIGALIVPEAIEPVLFASYLQIRDSLPKENGEVKGRSLNENQVDLVIDLLRSHPVIFEANVIDLGLHTSEEIIFHRSKQAEVFEKNIAIAHYESMRTELRSLRTSLLDMSLQLYIQSVMTFELIDTVMNHGTLYFVQRIPNELGRFGWIIDGKDRLGPTPWEDWWRKMIPAMLQSKSAQKPLIMLTGADYSQFGQFEIDWPADAAPNLIPSSDGKAIDLKLIMQRDFRFSSQIESGLELVDILTCTLRRALKGNLQYSGWKNLPRIMVHRPGTYFQALGLFPSESSRVAPASWPAKEFRQGGRGMLV